MADSKHPRSAEVLAREEGDSKGLVEETASMSGGLRPAAASRTQFSVPSRIPEELLPEFIQSKWGKE